MILVIVQFDGSGGAVVDECGVCERFLVSQVFLADCDCDGTLPQEKL